MSPPKLGVRVLSWCLLALAVLAVPIQAEEIRIDKPQKAVLVFTTGRKFSGELESLNAKEVRFKLGGKGNAIVYKSSQLKEVQLENETLTYNATKGEFEKPAENAEKDKEKGKEEPADAINIDSPQPGYLLLKNGKGSAGQLQSLNSKEVRFAVGGKSTTYPAAQVKAVQVKDDVYVYHPEKNIFVSMKALQAQFQGQQGFPPLGGPNLPGQPGQPPSGFPPPPGALPGQPAQQGFPPPPPGQGGLPAAQPGAKPLPPAGANPPPGGANPAFPPPAGANPGGLPPAGANPGTLPPAGANPGGLPPAGANPGTLPPAGANTGLPPAGANTGLPPAGAANPGAGLPPAGSQPGGLPPAGGSNLPGTGQQPNAGMPGGTSNGPQPMTQQVMEKRCGKCNQVVPDSSTAGGKCPHCGVRWDFETDQSGKVVKTSPAGLAGKIGGIIAVIIGIIVGVVRWAKGG